MSEGKFKYSKEIELVYGMRDEIFQLRNENFKLNRQVRLLETLVNAIDRADQKSYGEECGPPVGIIRERLIELENLEKGLDGKKE